MSDVKAKIQHIPFPLMGFRPRPRWGTYSAPRPLAAFKRPTSKGREWKENGRKRRRESERMLEREGGREEGP